MIGRMQPVSHHRPTSVDEAVALLAEHGASARVLAGGTDLVLKLRAGNIDAAHLVSIGRIPGLDRLEHDPKTGLSIGAGVRLADVGRDQTARERYPALAHACSVMATCQIRNMGTVAGNLANGSPCADTSAPLLVYGAEVVLAGPGGKRTVTLDRFFRGPGEVDIAPTEMVERIVVPPPRPGTFSSYLRLSARSKVDMAAVGVAGALTLDKDGKVQAARLALSAVAPTPIRCPDAEGMLMGKAADPALIERCAEACAQAARPIDDVRASAAYRLAMVSVLCRRVLTRCAAGAPGGPT